MPGFIFPFICGGHLSCFHLLAIKTITVDHSFYNLARAFLQSDSDPSLKLFCFISWKGFGVPFYSRAFLGEN